MSKKSRSLSHLRKVMNPKPVSYVQPPEKMCFFRALSWCRVIGNRAYA